MPKVTPILPKYFADLKLWTDFNFVKFRIDFFLGRLLANKHDVWTQKVVHTSRN